MPAPLFRQLQRAAQMPPHVVARRLRLEAGRYWDRWFRAETDLAALLRQTGAANVDSLWEAIAARPYATARPDPSQIDELCPGARERILQAAERALRRRVDLLGSGEIELGPHIDWHCDYVSGIRWEPRFAGDMQISDPELPSDVKFPWELSRLQWLIPLGQAYILTGEERYAADVRDVLSDWIGKNPYQIGVNWTCPMEAAMRIYTWTWFFHVFQASRAWSAAEFREKFLCHLYSHARFTERYLEYSDVNGNHCTADAAGLVFAGLFFGNGRNARRWRDDGWRLLVEELPRQVTADGVDFEGSIAYHRLVAELFFFAALYRQRQGLDVPGDYLKRLLAMARFTQAYTPSHAAAPAWGDNDDARVLPFGVQALYDHRYLPALVAAGCARETFELTAHGPLDELFWTHGPETCRSLLARTSPAAAPSTGFAHGGYYVMRNDQDHVFIDCAPVGAAGRGGHGHNDCLSLAVTLCNQPLVVDCGSYVYTRSYHQRNEFRSTEYHNTPCVDGQQINRFISPGDLWHLHNDAQPVLLEWTTGEQQDVFRGSHSGYQRLADAVTPVRTVTLDHDQHQLEIRDELQGAGSHEVSIPLHLAAGIAAEVVRAGLLLLRAPSGNFSLSWESPDDWNLEIGAGRVSPCYGVVQAAQRLCWRRSGSLRELVVRIRPG